MPALEIDICFDDIHQIILDSLTDKTRKSLNIRSRENIIRRLMCNKETLSRIYILLKKSVTIQEVLEGNVPLEEVMPVSSTSLSRCCSAATEEDKLIESTRYNKISELLRQRDKETNRFFNYETCVYRLDLADSWKRLLELCSKEEQAEVKSHVTEMLENITRDGSNFQKRLQAALDDSCESLLASLTLISLTLDNWETRNIKSGSTVDLILMLLPNDQVEAEEDKKRKEQRKAEAKLIAQNHLTDNLKNLNQLISEGDFEKLTDNHWKKLFEMSDKTLKLEYLEDRELLGQAHFYLSLYYNYFSEDKKMARKHLTIAQNLGYKKAIEYNEIPEFSLTYKFPEAQSSVIGACICNCDNIYTQFFLKTKPKKWDVLSYASENKDQLLEERELRYLFFDEDSNKNFVDLIKLLEMIREEKMFQLINRVEVFIRCDSDQYEGLIDTAQNYLKEYVVTKKGTTVIEHVMRIHVIDDAKKDAQYLLSHHPLFYPVKSEHPQSSSYKKEKNLLNFVIIGTNRCAEWLVREAFWLMTFLEDIECKITILAPGAEKMYAELLRSFPGFDKNNKIIQACFNQITEIEPVEIETFSSANLEKALNKLLDSQEYLYFAVSGDKDLENLNLAIHIRQHIMRHLIFKAGNDSKKNEDLRNRLFDMPPIAFHCKDSDVANLASHMVISKLDQGDLWYNNYRLIPFGAYSNSYTFEDLNGGILEKLALCINMEYENITPISRITDPEEKEKTEVRYHNAFLAFYRRQYNHDSAYCVALDLPYRLFNIYNKTKFRRVLPATWNILDSNYFYDPENLKMLCADLPNPKHDENYIESLADREQTRWSRHLLSRRWFPATKEQMELYQTEAYKSHQLYIAKLHPYICDFNQLKVLEKDLGKDLSVYNRRNIERTRDILELAWL